MFYMFFIPEISVSYLFTKYSNNIHNKFYVFFFVGYSLLYAFFQNVEIRVIYSSDVNTISSSSLQP